MSNKRAPGRSLEEWMELVTECSQSGLPDTGSCGKIQQSGLHPINRM